MRKVGCVRNRPIISFIVKVIAEIGDMRGKNHRHGQRQKYTVEHNVSYASFPKNVTHKFP
jgi:hypothetical protein